MYARQSFPQAEDSSDEHSVIRSFGHSILYDLTNEYNFSHTDLIESHNGNNLLVFLDSPLQEDRPEHGCNHCCSTNTHTYTYTYMQKENTVYLQILNILLFIMKWVQWGKVLIFLLKPPLQFKEIIHFPPPFRGFVVVAVVGITGDFKRIYVDACWGLFGPKQLCQDIELIKRFKSKQAMNNRITVYWRLNKCA